MNNQTIHNPKRKNKRKIIISILFIITLIVVAGTSYAMWQMTLVQTSTNKLSTGCIDLNLTNNTNNIILENAYPIEFSEENFEEKMEQLPVYSFTLENTCTTNVSYYVNLENVTSAEKKLDESVIEFLLQKEGTIILQSILSSDVLDEEIILEEAISASRLYEGHLAPGGKATFDLRLWMTGNTPAEDEFMNASYESKVSVKAVLETDSLTDNILVNSNEQRGEISNEDGLLKYINHNYVKFGADSYVSKLKKIVFENSKNPYSEAEKVYDFSQVQNGSILGYYVKDTDDKYILYIQADGNIKIDPQNPELALFADETTEIDLEGLENIEATDLHGLFESCKYLIKADLSKLNTSNVTDMQTIFLGCENITATINIMNKDVNLTEAFTAAAIEEGSSITLNYTKETEALVDDIITNKDENSNIIKGTLIG